MPSCLHPSLVARIVQIKASFDEVYPKSIEEWVEGFELDALPEREIMIWECMAIAYLAFSEGHLLSRQGKDEALKCILACSLGRSDDLVTSDYKALQATDIQDLVRHYRSAAESIYASDHVRQITSPLTPNQAMSQAREHLRQITDVRLCDKIPLGLYAFNPQEEYLFMVVHGAAFRKVGGTKYLAVSKVTGEVRHAGTVGE